MRCDVREATITALRADQRIARSRLLAQHDEITALRAELARRINVRVLPALPAGDRITPPRGQSQR